MNVELLVQNALRLSSIERIGKEMTMENTPEWDSIAHLELVVSVEKVYKINLTGNDIVNMTSVAGIYEVLAKYQVKDK